MHTTPDYNALLISLIPRLARHLGITLEKELATLELTLQEFKILGLLIGEAGISQKDLAQKLGVRAATLSVAINKLEQKQRIIRTPATEDKRINLLSLHPDLDISEANQLLQNVETKITANIPAEHLQIAKDVLQQLNDNLHQEGR